jgi:hypothetical protein
MGKTYRKAKTGTRTWRIDDNIDYDEVKSSLRNDKDKNEIFFKEEMRMEECQ